MKFKGVLEILLGIYLQPDMLEELWGTLWIKGFEGECGDLLNQAASSGLGLGQTVVLNSYRSQAFKLCTISSILPIRGRAD